MTPKKMVDDSWGGAIELSILAEHFQCEIAAYDASSDHLMLDIVSRG